VVGLTLVMRKLSPALVTSLGKTRYIITKKIFSNKLRNVKIENYLKKKFRKAKIDYNCVFCSFDSYVSYLIFKITPPLVFGSCKAYQAILVFSGSRFDKSI